MVRTMKMIGKWVVALALLLATSQLSAASLPAARTMLSGHVPAAIHGLAPKGTLPATNRLYLAIGLPLHNEAALDDLIAQLYDPQSTNFHKFLAPAEFDARFGPTESEYQNLIQFAATNGLTVKKQHGNRRILDVEGSAADISRAFALNFHTYRHPDEPRDFFAPDNEPSVPAGMPVADMWGLSDYTKPHPMVHPANKTVPVPLGGSGSSGYYLGRDFRNAYAPGTTLTGAGQTLAIVELDGFYLADITNYESQAGYTNVPVQTILLNGVSGTPGYSGVANANLEVSLDIELAIAMAPGLAKVIVCEGSNPYDIFNQIVTNNTARQISSSWSFGYGPTHNWNGSKTTLDSLLSQMVAQGQCFFQASGDSDAYTGSQAFSSFSGPIPMDSPYLVSVGGTTLTMNGSGTSWSSETTWNYAHYGGAYANEGSGGGSSGNYSLPTWQAGISMTTNNGSTTHRNLPDVALTADSILVVYNNGTTVGAAGTSCAAPLWAGFAALVNQQAAANNATNNVGFINPAIYALATNSSYLSSFHDIVTGNNIGTHTAGLYYATNGYDLATGLGTPAGTNLINVLAPKPGFLTQPVGLTATNGLAATLAATGLGAPPLAFQWRLAGTNLPGATAATLTLNPVTTNSAGNYALVITNAYGALTSSVAAVTVVLPPAITAQPAGLTVFGGSNAVFTVTASGNTPLAYQWRKNSVTLTNGTGIAGATTNVLTLTGVTTNSNGNYSVVITNLYGAATSSVASLTVVLPPAFITTTVTNQTLQCGSNTVTCAVTASGTPPLAYQWSLDGLPITNATNTFFYLTNLTLPSHTVSVTVTNLYGSVTSNALLTVQDTLPPVITLNGGNPLTIELNATFADPGANAYDTCAGTLPVTVTGSVNTNAVGTNTLFYTANDGNGNTNTATRTVMVQDTTPPVVQWSFTNLVLAADTNCGALMPDVTGTNFIVATDLSGVLTISQTPTNQATLILGTNAVVIAVADASENTTYSTNVIVVLDETPPVVVSPPASQTNLVGNLASLSVGATACTPLAYQWFFLGSPLAGATNATFTQSNLTVAVAGNYFATVTAAGGSTTSAVATLTIVSAPAFLTTTVTNRLLECGSNEVTCYATATGTAPLGYQWSLDALPVPGATNTSFALTNLTLPSHVVGVTVTNLYGTMTSNAVFTVQDTLAPVITLAGDNPLILQLGNPYAEPGVMAYDTCAGVVGVTTSGLVNTNQIGTNFLVYTADDGNGNTNTATRTVLVQDTNAPVIQWSFTNLVLAADTNCGALMPDVTGTNSLIASNADGVLLISQRPTNQALLSLGTNVVIISVADAAGTTVYSTNTIVVLDETPPVVVSPPASQTNTVGGTVGLSVGATACTPLSYQWYFAGNPVAGATNASIIQSNLTVALAGDYFVVATAAGGSATSAVATLAVNPIATTVAPTSTANPAGFRDSLVFRAMVSPTNATGTVQFLTNGVLFDAEPLVAGQATSTNTAALPRGTNSITVAYSGDANDLPATNELAQIVTNHPPVGAPVTLTYGAGTVLNLALTNLSALWSDADGDTVSLAGINPSTNGITLTNNDGTLTYANPNNLNDQFACLITDGWGDTNSQTVYLQVVFPAINQVKAQPDGTLRLQLTGWPGYAYVLESTVGLVPADWQPVTTNLLDDTGTGTVNASPATNAPQSFYRLRLLP